MILESPHLDLVLQTPEQARESLDQMSPADRAQVSVDWLALLDGAQSADPWIHGFVMRRKADGAVVGQCGFKGPPSIEGIVELAYGVAPEYQGQGYATEAAHALVRFAFTHANVRLVRAHTLPESNASTRVLTKCGFHQVGDFLDPEDGPVWRWEIGPK